MAMPATARHAPRVGGRSTPANGRPAAEVPSRERTGYTKSRARFPAQESGPADALANFLGPLCKAAGGLLVYAPDRSGPLWCRFELPDERRPERADPTTDRF